MTTKKGTKVLTELLNIQGIKVTQMSQIPGIGIISSQAKLITEFSPNSLRIFSTDETRDCQLE
jgi:hypothetical protein